MRTASAVALLLLLLVWENSKLTEAQHFREKRGEDSSASYEGEYSDEHRQPSVSYDADSNRRTGSIRDTPYIMASYWLASNQQGPPRGAGLFSYAGIYDIPRRVANAVGDKVQLVSSAVQLIPYMFTTFTSTVSDLQGYTGSSHNTQGQTDMRPSASRVLYPQETHNSGPTGNNDRQSSNGFNIPTFQHNNPRVNRFPVLIVDPVKDQVNPLPFGGQQSSSGTLGLPVASGGVQPPDGYVSDDQPFMLDFDQLGLGTFNPSNPPQSQNNFNSGSSTNNFPSQGASRPQLQGSQSQGLPRPQSQGSHSQGFPRPQQQGSQSQGFPRPQSQGSQSQGFPGPQQQGSQSQGFPKPQYQGSQSQGFSRPQSQGSQSQGFPGPQSQGSNHPHTTNNFGSSSSFPLPSINGFEGSPNTPSNSNVFTVVNGIQEFTLDLLSTFRGLGKRGNIIFSPVSISSLLSLLTLATNGLSRHEIEVALNLPTQQSSFDHHNQYEAILRRLNQNSQGLNISTSSRLFLEKSVPVYGSFTQKAADHYNCSVSLERFRDRPEQTMRRVNRWVTTATEGKITEFISEPFSPSTLFVAANTIYFSGDWETPFSEYFTGPRDFDTGRKIIQVPMMTNVFTAPHYYSAYINADIVSMPYVGGEFSMFIILPRESPREKSIKVLENKLDTFLIEELISNMTSKQVSVSLPKMRMSMKSSLVDSFSQLNIQSIFSPITADFSELTNTRPLWVSAFLHEAVMEITEKGTVAAAVSAATLDRIGGYQRINVNKPAIIFIRDKVTGLPLFWTRLVKPDPISKT